MANTIPRQAALQSPAKAARMAAADAVESINGIQIAKRVESVLYDYPVLKINLVHLYPRCGGIHVVRRNGGRNGNPVESIGILRMDYLERIKLIEATINILDSFQREFIELRYFKKRPFKIIAEEMAVTERHLYRIRQEIIRIFSLAFGWKCY
jgi:hypothetical protein